MTHRRRPLHGLVYVGLTLLCMLVGFVVFSALSTWWQQTQDSTAHPSHFLALNPGGHLSVIEMQGGDVSKTVIYAGPVIYGQGADLVAITVLSEQARTSLGAGYSVQGAIKTSVTQVATTEAAHGTLSLLVSVQGEWSYQFSSAEISQLSRRIAGLSRQQAIHLLKQDPHIQTVSITETWNAASIPTDLTHIQIMVLDTVSG